MPVRYVARKFREFLVYRVLHVDDTPHRIALGVAIGLFIAWTPTVGFQMALTVLVAAVLRANKAAGVPLAWITNPATIAPIYGTNYLLGCWLLAGHHRPGAMRHFISAVLTRTSLLNWLEGVLAAMNDVFWPLWLGSVLLGVMLAAPTYFLTRYAIVKHREHFRRKHGHDPWQHTPNTRDAP